MSRKVSNKVSSISVFNGREVDNQDPRGEEFQALKREGEAILTGIATVGLLRETMLIM